MTTLNNKLGVSLIRHSLGFNYPGQLQMCMMTISMLYCYCFRQKLTGRHCKAVTGANILVYAVGRTTFPFAFALGYLVLLALEREYSLRKQVPNALCAAMPLLCFGGMLLATALEDQGTRIGALLDALMQYRLSLHNTALELYDVTWLGTGFHNSVVGNNGSYLYLDSECMYMLVSNGLVYTGAILLLLVRVNQFVIRRENSALFWAFAIFYAYAIVNNGIINLVMCPFSIVLV